MPETTELTISKMPKGGFVVREAPDERGRFCQQLFARTQIGEALNFIRDELTPKEPGS